MIFVGLGLIAIAVVCGSYVLITLYRGAKKLLEDPDTYKLLDGKESE